MTTKTAEETYTLTQLHQRFYRWVQKNISHQKFWVECEIVKVNMNGQHWYLELADTNEQQQTTAKAKGMIWSGSTGQIRRSFQTYGVRAEEIIKPGNRIKVKCSFQFHSIHGLSLVIDDMDPSTTLGDIAKQKQETLKRLDQEGLMDLQKGLYLSPLSTRIAIIGSEGSSGLDDFLKELTANQIYTGFKYKVFPTTVQGDQAVEQIAKAIGNAAKYDVDAIVIVRGGGSKMDLHVFNHYIICRAIAYSRVPVITGVGHESDNCLVDLVAHESQKTPTAAAKRFYISIGTFNAALSRYISKIQLQVQYSISEKKEELQYYNARLKSSAIQLISNTETLQRNAAQHVFTSVNHLVKTAREQLSSQLDLYKREAFETIAKSNNSLSLNLMKVRERSLRVINEDKDGLIALNNITVVRTRYVFNGFKEELKFVGEKLNAVDPTRLFKTGYTMSTIDGQDINDLKGDIKGKQMVTYSDQLELKSTIISSKKR